MQEYNLLRSLLSLSLLLAAPSAFAHISGEAIDHAWNFEPEVVLPLLLMVAAYVSGIHHLQRQGIRSRIVGVSRCSAFALGILVLVVALISPLDRLAEFLFSAHMTQHLILMLVAPPLLVLGRMDVVLLWTFPLPLRRWIGQQWRKATRLHFAVGLLSQPISLWLLASAVMWFWHVPGPYAWAFNNSYIHIIEHLSFFLTSLAFWTLVLRPFSRNKSGHGNALMLLVGFMLESSLLGALLVFAGHPFYLMHVEHVSRHFLSDLSPLQDQQLAGLIMWIPAGLVYLLMSVAVFADLLSMPQSQQAGSLKS
ncbi:MAG: cytochrome c oxidase assembly protein [Methylobacter sp.]